jgi:hypothetical protein
MKTKIIKKIEKLSKTEQKSKKKKNQHPFYLPVFVDYFDKKKKCIPATLYTYKVVG